MPRAPGEPLVRVHIQLYESDWELMAVLFDKNIGRSHAVRDIVRKVLNQIRAAASESSKSLPVEPVNAQLASIIGADSLRGD